MTIQENSLNSYFNDYLPSFINNCLQEDETLFDFLQQNNGFLYLELTLMYIENDKKKLIEKFKESAPIIQKTIKNHLKEIKSSDELSLANSIAKDLAFFIAELKDQNQFYKKLIEGWKTKKNFKLLKGFSSSDAQLEIRSKLLDFIEDKKDLNIVSKEIATRLSEIVRVYNNIKDEKNLLKGSKKTEMFLRSLSKRFLDVRFYMSEYLIRYTLQTAFEDGQIKRIANNYGKNLADFVANRLTNVLEAYNYGEVQEFINKKSHLNFTYNHLNFMESYMKVCFNKDLKGDPRIFFEHLPVKGRKCKTNGSYKLEIVLRDIESYEEDLDRVFCQSGEAIRNKLKTAFEEGQRKGLENNFQEDNCLADFVAGKIAEWIRETMENKVQEKDKNHINQGFSYAPSLFKRLNYEYRKIRNEERLVNKFIYIIGQQDLTNEKAKEHLHYGVGRRLDNIVRCIENVYHIWPLHKFSPRQEDIIDVEINLESFIINCDALFNNLAYIWKEERANEENLKLQAIGLNKNCRKMRKLFSQDFQNKLKCFDTWFENLTCRRNSLAHRIPPYIPPFSVGSDDKQKLLSLYKEQKKMLLSGDRESYNEVNKKIESYKHFIPCMWHSYEGAQKHFYFYFHIQVIDDWKNIINILEDFFEELVGEHYPFHLIDYSSAYLYQNSRREEKTP